MRRRPSAYAWAIFTGSKLGWMTPLEGDAFFTSAMSAGWPSPRAGSGWRRRSRGRGRVLKRGADELEGELLLALLEPHIRVPDDLLEDVDGLVDLVVHALTLGGHGLHLERELVRADVVQGGTVGGTAADGNLGLGVLRGGGCPA